MEFAKIDDRKEMLVDFYVSDMARGIENPGLNFNEMEALRLAIAFERENGREPVGKGSTFAASRMLDNVFDADDGPYESAKLMVADMAFQRYAGEVVDSAERWAKDGTEPKGVFDDSATLIQMVIKEDLQNDPDVKADWLAISEGRFHDVSPMSHGFLIDGIKDGVGLEANAGQWLYDNQVADVFEEYQPSSRLDRGMDALDMADDEEARRDNALQQLGSSWQEHVAGEPGYDFLSPEEQDRSREDWFEKARRELGMPEDEIAALRAESERGHRMDGAWESLESIGQRRYDQMLKDARDPDLLVEDIEVSMGRGWQPRSPDMKDVPDLLRGMTERADPRLETFSHAVAHEMLDDLGASASAATAWMFDERPTQSFAEAYAAVAAPVAQEGGMAGAVADAARAGPSGIDGFDERRLEAATGPDAGGYRPFRPATSQEMDRAEAEVSSVVQAIAMNDHTIFVDPGLERAARLLNVSGMEIGGERVDALTRAYARAEARETEKGPMSPNEKARLIVFDVATQEEARGMVMSNAGGIMNVARGAAIEKPARDMVTKMGIRTLQQEMPSDVDLGYIANGRFDRVEEYHRAGLDLGMAWASAEKMPEIDKRLERLAFPSIDVERFGSTPGVVGEVQRADDFAAALDRASSKGPEPVRAKPPVMSKGPQDVGADYAAFMAGRGGDKGR